MAPAMRRLENAGCSLSWGIGGNSMQQSKLGLSFRIALVGLLIVPLRPATAQSLPPVEGVSLTDLSSELAHGSVTSEAITHAYLDRLARLDRRGPEIRAVIAVNPDALDEARAADRRRASGQRLGPLDGIPILVKDNIETRDPIATTAGSLALKDNVTGRDAPVVAELRKAGVVILGKANLSEWADMRSPAAPSGWSAVGGQARNHYVLDRSPCGSSSGSGAGVAASFAAAALGTETDGSVICPSSMNGLVGLKPTLGLISRTHVVPISHNQDTPGPIARNVRDLALLLSAMIASDPADPAARDADAHRADYTAGLDQASLRGVRIAVLRPTMPPDLAARFDAALAVLKARGAVLVEAPKPATTGIDDAELKVLLTDLKADMNAYLATTPPAVQSRTLADLIAFNEAHKDAEMAFFGQEHFTAAEKTAGLADPAYVAARATALRLARAEGIDAILEHANAAMIVEPGFGPAWLIDPIYGDQYSGPAASQLPAIAGYPILTVPMGLVKGLPVGLAFVGRAYSEGKLLGAGYVFEQAQHQTTAPTYAPTVRYPTAQ